MNVQHKTIGSKFLASCIIGAAALACVSTAIAMPDKPDNAAVTAKGEGCIVRDAAGDYHFDTECKWHTVTKRDRYGNLVSYKYQDKGSLPDDAPHPDSAIVWDGTPINFCSAGALLELTNPNGKYMSSCHIKFN